MGNIMGRTNPEPKKGKAKQEDGGYVNFEPVVSGIRLSLSPEKEPGQGKMPILTVRIGSKGASRSLWAVLEALETFASSSSIPAEIREELKKSGQKMSK